MSKLRPYLADIASAIREKKGSSEPINAKDFSNEIRSIQSGGDDDLAANVEGTTLVANAIETAVIGKGITKLGGACFMNFKFLKKVVLHDEIKEISYNAFSGCTALEGTFVLPIQVTSLENQTFQNCSSLEVIIIPSVNSIGQSVFFNCTKLRRVIIQQSKEVAKLWNINAFQNNDASRLFYVPDALVDAYKSATNWSTYADAIRPLSELPNE